MGLCGSLGGHHQLERGTHTCLDVVLNDERYIKNVEVWEAVRVGMGKLWRTWLGGNRELERALGLEVMKRVVAQELKKNKTSGTERYVNIGILYINKIIIIINWL